MATSVRLLIWWKQECVHWSDWTALRIAAYKNHTYVVPCLLDKGANVGKQTCDGWTALHEASYKNHTNVIRILLRHGARKDIKDSNGYTPINHARLLINKEAVDLLKQY